MQTGKKEDVIKTKEISNAFWEFCNEQYYKCGRIRLWKELVHYQ